MQFRDYGKTGLRPSALGFGAMRLPKREDGTCDYDVSVPMLVKGLDLGITYIDSAWGYINGTSEVAVGRAIQGRDRGDLIISTKIPIRDIRGKEWRERLEIQLQRFDTPYIDIMHMHNLHWSQFEANGLGEGGCLEAARQAQQEGLIRYLAFSSHDTPENVVRLIETGEFDGVTLQYNLLDRSMEDPIRAAHARGLGVTVMGPVGGGRMAMWSPQQAQELWPDTIRSAPDLAIRWVLSNPEVSVALSGMNGLEMIDENVASAAHAEPLNAEENAAVQAMLGRLQSFANLYCTGCDYCMPCPNDVDIPGNFLLMNFHRVYGMTDYARANYAKLANGEKVNVRGHRTIEGLVASECIQCGECEPKCPQNIQIIDQLEEVAATLG
ncbi:MAG: aldo/keto reductase [Chloroflexi bacterium]|nr:aldo/keto reductase [Chloroflexota bacterium]